MRIKSIVPAAPAAGGNIHLVRYKTGGNHEVAGMRPPRYFFSRAGGREGRNQMKFGALHGLTKAARFAAVAAVAMSGLFLGLPARADIIHESATFVPVDSLGPAGIPGGSPVTDTQFLGSRFSVTETVNVDKVGGHIYGHPPVTGTTADGPIFAAILPLSSPTALPVGTFDETEIAFTLLRAPLGFIQKEDFLVPFPLSVTLEPGHYALIFGSATEFSAPGIAIMPNINVPDSGSYFFWNGSKWSNGGGGTRFVVTGVAALPPGPLAVDIDIKPGSDPNSINLCGGGVVPVAILGSDTFDATKVNPDVTTLADKAVRIAGKSGKTMCHDEDVEPDGDLDKVCIFATVDLALVLDLTSTEATVHGFTSGGTEFEGTDDIRIVIDCP